VGRLDVLGHRDGHAGERFELNSLGAITALTSTNRLTAMIGSF
jgi:hypothetical protein